jgi:outer membrane lipoprotein-sorting protein
MRIPRRCAPVALTLVLSLTSSSCLWTHRVILRGGKRVASGAAAPPLQASSLEGLLTRITNLYNAIESFQATVDMTPSVGSVYKGQINEGSGLIKDVTSYVLYHKPDSIRIIGKAPVVRTTEFDMVSHGDLFKVYLVSKNLFVEGSNSAPATSKSVLENLRPEHFLSAMLIRPADSANEVPILEDNTDEENAIYEVHFLRKKPNGEIRPGRVVWFDRLNLSIVRQRLFDENGLILSDTRYAKWQSYNGVMFPSSIDIQRPEDNYGVAMQIVDMKMNVPLTDEQFALAQPEGTQVRKIGESAPGVSK